MTAPLVLKLHGGGYIAVRLAGPTLGSVEAFLWQQPPSAWRPFGDGDLQVTVATARRLALPERERPLDPLNGAVVREASPTRAHLVLAGSVLNRYEARRLFARLGDPWHEADDVEHDSGIPHDDLAEQRRELRESRGEVDRDTGEGFRGRRW